MTKILFGGLFIYVSVLAVLWLMRTSLIYPLDPTHVSPDRSRLPDITEQTLRTADGNDLVIWTAPARAGEPTVLYFPGNAGNLGDRTERFRRFRLQGIGLVAMAYRGSNGSTGKASEAAVTADARLLRDRMFDLLGTGKSSAVIYYGESLGSAVAVKLATTHAPAGLILEAPFTSVPDVAAQAFPIFPARLILDEHWNTDEHIRNLNAPLLVIHGTEDEVVPYAHGLAVFDAAGVGEKFFESVEGGAHNNLWSVHIQKTIVGFLDRF
jgi:fermentation-respiration switch protein FrsA (DUF1100 family)